jgi:anti-anti-sigma factor
MAADGVRFDAIGPVFELPGRAMPRGVRWVRARQDLDLATVSRARAELTSLLSASDHVCVLVHLGVDCFVDLHGLRLLVDLTAQARQHQAELVVVAAPRCLRRTARLAGLDSRLNLAPTARQGFRRARARTGSRPLAGAAGRWRDGPR